MKITGIISLALAVVVKYRVVSRATPRTRGGRTKYSGIIKPTARFIYAIFKQDK